MGFLIHEDYGSRNNATSEGPGANNSTEVAGVHFR